MIKMKINVIGVGVADVVQAPSMKMAKAQALRIAREGHFIETPDEIAYIPPHLIGTINMETA